MVISVQLSHVARDLLPNVTYHLRIFEATYLSSLHEHTSRVSAAIRA